MDGSSSAPEVVAASDARRRGRDHAFQSIVPLEVPFHDVDPLGIVWHGHYYKYLELARTALMRSRGLDAGDLLDLGYGMVMVETRCRHVAPLRYGDRAEVVGWLRDLRHRICIGYEITRLPSRTRVARASTVLATVDHSGRLLLSTPEVIVDRLQRGRGVAPEGEAAGL